MRDGNDALPDPVYRELRRLIIEGHYPPGTRLIEERLATDLGVSRTPVRQALARVATEGLVQTFPHRGAFVRTLTADDLVQIYDLRAVLEGYAAARAAVQITAEQLDILEREVQALESASSIQFASHADEIHFLVDHNQVFHQTIVVASSNQRLQAMLSFVVDVPLQYRSFHWYGDEERRVSNFFHRSILAALRVHDADRARSLMHEHVLYGRDALLRSMLEGLEG